MKKLKVLLALGCAALAVGVIAAPASAQSGTATGKFATGAQPPPMQPPSTACELTFDWDNNVSASPAGPNQTIDISNVAEVPGQCPNFEIDGGSGVLTTDAGSSWGYASFVGSLYFTITTLFGSLMCSFDATSNTGMWVGDYIDVYSPSMSSGDCFGVSMSDVRFWATL